MGKNKTEEVPTVSRSTYIDPSKQEVLGNPTEGSENTGAIKTPKEPKNAPPTIQEFGTIRGENIVNGTVGSPETPEQKLYRDIERWWLDLAHTEINALIPKAIEYGGTGRDGNLIALGRSMVEAGFPVPKFKNEDGENEFYAELAIYFYIQGKLARWGAALKQGNFVSDDTVHDIGIYVKMVQRIRDIGGWLV